MKNRDKIRDFFYFFYKNLLLLVLLPFSSAAIYAECVPPPILSQVDIHFYEHDLGQYTINLMPTLNAIKSDQASSDKPYYKKMWYGDCPGGLPGSSGSCVEYTVYPDATNFFPGDIMKKIEQYTHNGNPNRGEVRVLTNAEKTQYVYTIDHEKIFCGPYSLQ